MFYTTRSVYLVVQLYVTVFVEILMQYRHPIRSYETIETMCGLTDNAAAPSMREFLAPYT